MSGKREALDYDIFRALRRWRYATPIVVSLVGIALSATLLVTLHNQEQNRIRDDFDQISQDHISILKSVISLDVMQLRSLRSFYDGSSEVERREFTAYVVPLLKDHPSIQALEWSPRVTASERSTFEQAAVQEGLPNFRITQYDPRGKLTAVSPRADYFPVLFAEPVGNNVAALGFDLATNPSCREAMNRSRDTGLLTATSAIRLSRETDDEIGIRLFLPVYLKNTPLKTVEQRRRNLQGFVVGVIRVRGLVEESLSIVSPAGIDMQLIDTTDPDNRQELHTHYSRCRRRDVALKENEMRSSSSGISLTETLDLADRRWTITCTPISEFIEARTHWYPWGVGAAGLLLTGLLTVYLIVVFRQNAKAAHLAAELTETNRQLEKESAERKQAELRLRASQAKYRAVYELSNEAIMLATPEEGFVSGNPAAVAMYGCRDEKELTTHGPADLSPVYQPDGALSSAKAQEMMTVALENGSHSFQWKHKRIDGSEFLSTVALTRMEIESKVFLQATVHDISEQEFTQEALRTGEKRLRLFVENVSDLVWTMDFSGQFTYMSPSMQRMLGRQWEEDSRITIADIMTPSSLSMALKTLKSIVAEAYTVQRVKTRTVELELLREDGSTVWTELTINGMRNESGEIAAVQGIARDISERKQAEEHQARLVKRLEGVNQLQEALLLPGPLQEKFKKITQTTVDLLDLDFCRIWMIQPGDLCDKGCIHAAAADEVNMCRHRESCLHLMASSGRYSHITGDHRRVPVGCYKIGRIASDEENKFLTNDVATDPRVHNHEWAENLGLVSFAGYKLRDADGKPIGVFAMFAKHAISDEDDALLMSLAETTSRVIIEEKTAEVIAQENAKLSAMIAGMDEGVIFVDAGNTIVEVNEYMCHLLQKRREDFVGKPIENAGCGGVFDRVPNQIERFRTRTHADPYAVQCRVSDMEGILRMQPIYRDNRYDGVLVSIVDVSDLVESRRQAEAANQAKSQFLANMSHEIRTPMTAILGYADLLMDPSINASSQNNYAAVIRRNGEHLLTLINDILDLSKIEAGRLSPDIRRHSVVAILADVVSVVRPRAEQRGITLAIEYPGELPETILTDGPRFRQAVLNLVSNAVKFTEKGGVRIVASFVRDFCGDQPAVRINVIDTGIGIRPEAMSLLFEPFSQGEAAVSRKFGGTGLGLTISHQIARLLGGDLTATSVWGEGSTFTLTMPTGDLADVRMLDRPAEADRDAARHLESASEDLKGMRVLLAEDGYDNRELIRSVLFKAGAQTECVENGLLAVERAQVGGFDVILMDMNMPEMDGYQATRLLRELGYTGPIFALTANAMTEDALRCKEAGCDEYLSKPINRTQLISMIAQYGGKQTVAPEVIMTPATQTLDTAERSPADAEIMVSEYSDDPDMATILKEFVGRLDDQVETMRQTYANGQYEELQRLGHRLKGAGGSYGFALLTNAGKQLEEAVKAADYGAAKAAIEKIATMCKAIHRGYAQDALAGREKS
jgi:PAS domain S-box-containing protein